MRVVIDLANWQQLCDKLKKKEGEPRVNTKAIVYKQIHTAETQYSEVESQRRDLSMAEIGRVDDSLCKV